MGCGEFIVKYVLFFANLFFALAGLALLGLGVAVQLQISPVVNAADTYGIQVAPIAAMVVGGIVFLVAFFGCCGAIRESNCMLVTYSILMIILMILKITLASLIFVNMDTLKGEVGNWLDHAFKDQKAFTEIQTMFECCGTSGPQSYPNPLSLPPSCCAKDASLCTIANAYKGCNDKVKEFIHTFGLAIGVMIIVIVSIELVAVVFGLCLANHARNKYRRNRY